jgi:hypothetical protein
MTNQTSTATIPGRSRSGRSRRARIATVFITFWAGLMAQPSDMELAYASRMAYFKDMDEFAAWEVNPTYLSEYKLLQIYEDAPGPNLLGFRAVALQNKQTRSVIIAFRGTDPSIKENVFVDLGMFLAITKDKPIEQLHREVGKLASFLGGNEGLTLSLANRGVQWANNYFGDPHKTETQQLDELIRMFLELDIEVAHSDHMKEMTRKCALEAIAFYRKVEDEVLKEAGEPKRTHYYHVFKHGYPDYTFTVTGHSLGGFLAQIVSATQGCHSVTFNSPGADDYINTYITDHNAGLSWWQKNRGKAMQRHDNPVYDHRNFVRDHDVVAGFGKHFGTKIYLGDFFEVPAEQERLRQAKEAAAAKCEQDRAALLAKRRAKYLAQDAEYQARLLDYPARQAAYLARKAEYDAAKAIQDQKSYMSQGLEWLGGSAPKAPEPPAVPVAPEPLDEERIRQEVVNPYRGNNVRNWAKVCYGIPGLGLRNHTLVNIVEQLELKWMPGAPSALPGDSKVDAGAGDGKAERSQEDKADNKSM